MGRTVTRSIVADLHLESTRKCRPKTTCGVKSKVRENPNVGFLTLSGGLCMRVDEGIAHMPSNFQRRKSPHGRQHACARRPDHTVPARQNPTEGGQRSLFRGEEAGCWDHCSGGSTRGYWRFESSAGKWRICTFLCLPHGCETRFFSLPAPHTPSRSVHQKIAFDYFHLEVTPTKAARH